MSRFEFINSDITKIIFYVKNHEGYKSSFKENKEKKKNRKRKEVQEV